MLTSAYPGSFDPVTEGHLHVLREALERFPNSKMVIVFQRNPTKQDRLVSYDNSQRLFRLALQDSGLPSIKMVESASSRGFLETLKKLGVSVVVRGVRGKKDIFTESVLRYFLPAACLFTSRTSIGVTVIRHNDSGSSTQVRHLLMDGNLNRAKLSKLVPPRVAVALAMAHGFAPPAESGREAFNDALARVLKTMGKASCARRRVSSPPNIAPTPQ